MNREFTLREKLLLLVLALVLVGLVYYQFVDKNVRGTLAGHIAEADQLQADLDIAQAQLVRLTNVQTSLNAVLKLESSQTEKRKSGFRVSDLFGN